ncbi:hypothetical protein FHS57_001573 [Runella defluvii]|uniref:Uncharacterized protein n=1 Tax=Runella defluvii TaxID=370973 RepID=A0A7W5ZI27_9BACT|nr:hypothetical protein [Runella defluvii]MBB3837576.1 hypothetical protein [Runella defluvii]
MKISLTVQETLIWHDYPHLFVAKDKIGGLQLCIAIDDTPQYISVALSVNRLQDLKLSKIDLYSVFAQPELDAWFRVNLTDKNEILAQAMPSTEKIPTEWLPMPNAFLPYSNPLRPETFDVVKVSAVAKEAGMNPTLLRQYLSGIKHPSREQALRVQDALHRVAQRLLEVQFV